MQGNGMNIKVCSTCKESKLMTNEYFGNHNTTKDGFRNECKECRNQKLVGHWNEDRTKLKCVKCNSYKSISEFHDSKDKKYRGCKDSRCKECKKETAKKRRTQRTRTDSFHRIFIERFNGMRDRAKKFNIPMELTIDDLKSKFQEQEGKCILSGIPMTTLVGEGRVSTNISVDQKDPGKGYTLGNVQLVCSAVNQMKSDLSVEELTYFCNAILFTTSEQEVLVNEVNN